MTQRNCHKDNAHALVDLLRQGMRERVVLLLGGPRIDHKLALELGFDAGFGPGTKPSDVANYLVARLTADDPATVPVPPLLALFGGVLADEPVVGDRQLGEALFHRSAVRLSGGLVAIRVDLASQIAKGAAHLGEARLFIETQHRKRCGARARSGAAPRGVFATAADVRPTIAPARAPLQIVRAVKEPHRRQGERARHMKRERCLLQSEEHIETRAKLLPQGGPHHFGEMWHSSMSSSPTLRRDGDKREMPMRRCMALSSKPRWRKISPRGATLTCVSTKTTAPRER